MIIVESFCFIIFLKGLMVLRFTKLMIPFLAQIRLVRGEFVDESGCPVPDWIGFIRAARNSQEQNLEAVSDLPGGQVHFYPITSHLCYSSICIFLILILLFIFINIRPTTIIIL